MAGKRKMKRDLTIFDKHQLKVARQTLRYSDVGAKIMGGMTKAEARAFIARLKKEGKISR